MMSGGLMSCVPAPTRLGNGVSIVACEELDLDDLAALPPPEQPHVVVERRSSFKDCSSSFLPRLSSLDENAPGMDASGPSLTSVKELEASLGRVTVPIKRSTAATDSGKLSESLGKSKTPVLVQNEDIDKAYHVYYTSELGRGKNSIVREAIERSTGKHFAVKTVKKCHMAEAGHVRREINLLSDLDYRSIIDLHAAYEDKNYVHMVMEFAKGGELHEYVMDMAKTKKKGKVGRNGIDERVAAAIVRKVVDAVAYLHEHNIVHRDMKLENIVFLSKRKPSFKDGSTFDTDIRLIDFGLSKRYDTHRSFGSLNKLNSFVGTTPYMAPELVTIKGGVAEEDRETPGYTHYSDLWSLGILAYALLSARPPFYGKDDAELFDRIRNCDEFGVRFPQSDWDGVSDEAKDFIRNLLVKDERKRPSALELRSHPWIKDALKNDRVTQKVGFLKKIFGGKKK